MSAEAVAAVVIALLAADSLQDTDERVRRTCNASAEDEGVKPLQATLASHLSSPERMNNLRSLVVSRGESASITYRDENRRTELASFTIAKVRGARQVITIMAAMSAEPLQEISKALRKSLGEKS